MDYCGECQTAIDNALGMIKVKFEPKFVEIKPTFGLPDMLAGIKNKETQRNQEDGINFPMVVCLNLPDCDYDNVEEYTHEGKTYRIAWDDGKEDELHYFVQMEYDIDKGEVTTNVWKADSYRDSFRSGKSSKHFMKKLTETLSEIFTGPPMKEPSGILPYLDFDFPNTEWDLKVPEKEKYVPKHELRSHKVTYIGWMVKSYIEDGRNCFDGHLSVVAPDGYNPDDINEMLDYELSISSYADEHIETVTEIRVK